jgi:hypothetical protein
MADHINFHCVIARFVWVVVGEALVWDDFPTSFINLFDKWIPPGAMIMGSKYFCLPP